MLVRGEEESARTALVAFKGKERRGRGRLLLFYHEKEEGRGSGVVRHISARPEG